METRQLQEQLNTAGQAVQDARSAVVPVTLEVGTRTIRLEPQRINGKLHKWIVRGTIKAVR